MLWKSGYFLAFSYVALALGVVALLTSLKKDAAIFLPVTLRNANRSLKFFYHHTLQ